MIRAQVEATTFQLCVLVLSLLFESERRECLAQVRRNITSNIKLKEQNAFTHTVTQKGKTAQKDVTVNKSS